MPLEIRQIGIRMEVGDTGESDADEKFDDLPGQRNGHDETRLIDRCVEAVLAELSRRAER